MKPWSLVVHRWSEVHVRTSRATPLILRAVAHRVILSTAVGIVLIGACRQPDREDRQPATESSESGVSRTRRVVILAPPADTPFEAAFRAGAEAGCDQEQMPADWKDFRRSDVEPQIKAIETAVAERSLGICICPVDRAGLVAAVSAAVQADFPVVMCRHPLVGGREEVPVVRTDHFRCGELAGQEIARLIDGRGEVLIVTPAEDTYESSERRQGVLFALKKFPEIDVVELKAREAGQGSPGWMSRVTQRNYAAICGLRAEETQMLCDLPAAGTVTTRPQLLGFGAWSGTADALRSGQLAATVLEDPHMMGYSAIVVMAKKLNGEDIGPLITTGEYLVKSEDLSDPRTLKLLDENVAASQIESR